jgi:hypothetical protein
MTATLAALDETTVPLVAALMPRVWSLDRDANFLRDVFEWRYLKRPFGHRTLLAIDGDRCIGLIDSCLRSYLLNGRRIVVREPADWFCLPEYRPFGIGLTLMRAMMRLAEPLLIIGGTEATRSILPRLGFQQIAVVPQMILPVTARGLGSYLLRRHQHSERAKYARAIPGFLPLRWPRRATPPGPDAFVEQWASGRELPATVTREDGLVELVEPADLHWISAAPHALLRAIILLFRLGNEPVGISLSQLEPTISGLDGRIVHLQLTTPSAEVAEWVVRETARRLAAGAAGFIRCRASSRWLIAALRRAGFVAAGAEPAHWYSRDVALPRGPISVSFLRGDDAVPFEAAKTFE